MEQRDYLLRQIELMTQALVALIRKLTGLKEDGSTSDDEIQQATNEMLTEQLGMELSDILNIPLNELTDRLLENNGLHFSNLELFAEIIYLNAEVSSDVQERDQLLKIALEILTLVDREEKTYSLARHTRINEIRTQLD
jgi:methionyl-tRNA synthetase